MEKAVNLTAEEHLTRVNFWVNRVLITVVIGAALPVVGSFGSQTLLFWSFGLSYMAIVAIVIMSMAAYRHDRARKKLLSIS